METIITHFTTLPTLTFFTIWAVLFSLLFFSMFTGFGMDLGFDADIDSSSSIIPELFIVKGLTKIPLAISLFIIFSIGLCISNLLQWIILPALGINYFSGELGGLAIAFGLLLFFPIFIVSLYVASPLLNFLGKHIQFQNVSKPLNLVGMECKISTSTVSSTFGEAIVIDGKKTYRIHVLSEDTLVLDDIAIIVEPKNKNGDYLIKKI